MIRNLVLKLPSLRCTSENAFSSLYRKRSFRSLSPVQRLRSVASEAVERSVSCPRAERGHSVVDISGKPQARTLCFSKEYYADNRPRDSPKEIQWRENPSNLNEVEEPKENTSFNKSDPSQMDTLEQYELEAARPRPAKSRDVFEAFSSKSQKGRYFHLQPNQMKPYGSQDNLYSPMLIRPTNSLKYPKKFKRYLSKEPPDYENSNTDRQSPTGGQRSYSTATFHGHDDARDLSTTKSCIAKEGDSTKDKATKDETKARRRDDLKFCTPKLPLYSPFSKLTQNSYKDHWAAQKERLDIIPPKYQPSPGIEEEQFLMEFSTPEMRRRRKEQENRLGASHYKSSYSDLIKMQLKEKHDAKLTGNIVIPANNDKVCVGCILKTPDKPNKMLDAFKSPQGRRSLTTRSKSNLLSGNNTPKLTTNDINNQKNFSKPSKSKKSAKSKKSNKSYNPECQDICTSTVKAVERAKQKRFEYEPDKCEQDHGPPKVYLPSKVKLPAAIHCSERPDYRDCKRDDHCDIPRADECLQVEHRPLPKLVPSNCPCIDEKPPTYAPKLEKLKFKFEDPPRGICHPPPCQTPRADDSNPYKHKPLKPYVALECPCLEPPPMYDVKLRRLPRCQPEEVCRPPRICPIINPCPPRADECYKILPKKLPVLEDSGCPCIDPPPPNIAPPIKRLNLCVPEPQRCCPGPPTCDEVERADDCLLVKKKKLPKFVPGDCPCEDKPMVDWNPKRLICEDEPEECIVPDPCKAFARADWGCWEYAEEVCDEVEDKCVEKKVPCVKPKEKPCRKKSICETGAGPLDYRHFPKRRFSNASSTTSLQTYQLKTKDANSHIFDKTTCIKTKANENSLPPNTLSPKKSKSTTKLRTLSRRNASAPDALHLIKMLNDLEKTDKSTEGRLLFRGTKESKIGYQDILKSIAATSAQFQRKEPKATTIPVKKPKTHTLTVSSRAISTTEHLGKNEEDIKRERDIEAKEICRKVKPTIKSLMCRKPCPRYHVCPTGGEHTPACKKERVPVCCEKEEPPYSSFSENIEESIRPYTNTPQWTCNRPQFGFHPVYKKEHDPFGPKKKKDKKNYSTSSLLAQLPIPEKNNSKELNVGNKIPITHPYRTNSSKQTTRQVAAQTADSGLSRPSSKGFLKRTSAPNLSTNQNRTLATKIFEIRPPIVPKRPKPSQECGAKSREEGYSPKISCETEQICKADRRWCCKREYYNPCTRKAPPFPAFSDCLDEEMEDILTECPLDKEKYLRMQPRFMNPPPKPLLLKPPPPIQGKIDVLKEQQCLREKFCIENEGVTQTCSDFGQPVSLMKTKKMVKEENNDCKRMEELKKIGRWPPFTLKSNRRRYSTAASPQSSRNFSTLASKSPNRFPNENNAGAKRIYVRNYHALTKGANKAVFRDSEDKIKEMAQKIFPNIDDSTKFIKLKSNQWKMPSYKIYEQLNRQSNAGQRARRYYTTYKIRRQNGFKRRPRPHMGNFKRRFSITTPLLRDRICSYRGRRHYKGGRSKATASSEKERCRIKTGKKICAKFTLNDCPPKADRKKCHRIAGWQDCTKPFSPYPAYSECKEHELVAPTCECDFEVEKMEDLQPRFSVLKQPAVIAKEYPPQERIDRALGVEYFRCKHGIPNEGKTIGCDSLNEYFNPKPDKKRHSTTAKPCKEKDSQEFVEFLVQDHKQPKSETSCCSQTCKNDCKKDTCEADRKKIENLCMSECLKSVPCHLPEEEKYCICKKRCQDIACEEIPRPAPEAEAQMPSECKKRPTKMDCDAQREKKLKNIECIAPPVQEYSTAPLSPRCKEMVAKIQPCRPKKSKNFTQLETIWQKVVNYFKARPNCPQPGDYKKMALKEKAEKAACAAGLVVLDPKCLPPDLVQKFRTPKSDCKACPNQDPCETKKMGTRSSSPEVNRKNFSTNFQPTRNYSKSMSCKNLEEINKMLEEGETKRRELNFRESESNMKKEHSKFTERKDAETSEALKMSLDVALHKSVNLAGLCDKTGKNQKTYFGYTNVIPSRENILERAWRISIETYNRYNYPRTYNLFNEFFTRVEKSIKTVEDLEKLKTENVLRELDEFLQNEEPDSKKKK